MRRLFLAFLSLLVGGAALSACSGPPSTDSGVVVVPHPGVEGLPANESPSSSRFHPVGYFAYQIPIIPIVFEVSTDGTFSVSLKAGAATPLGSVSFSGGLAERASDNAPVPIESVGVTQLIICKFGTHRHVCRGYVIRTGRKVTIAMNGRTQAEIDNGVVTISAYSGATVTVQDDAAQPQPSGPRPAARIDIEDFSFTPDGPYTEVDLEQLQGGVENDLAYDHVTGALYGINGAKVADIQHYRAASGTFSGETALPQMNLPGEENCARTPARAWTSSFTATDLRADITVACVFTAEQDFGYLVIGRDPTTKPISYYVYSYIWVR